MRCFPQFIDGDTEPKTIQWYLRPFIQERKKQSGLHYLLVQDFVINPRKIRRLSLFINLILYFLLITLY